LSLGDQGRDTISWATQKGQVISRKLEGKGLGGWVLEKGGSLACKTDLKSKVRLVTPSGSFPNHRVGSNDGDKVAFWEKVPPGSKIEWEVTTYADKQEVAADRFQMELTYLDVQYITRLVNEILGELTDQQMQDIAAGNTKIIEEKVESKLNISQAIVSVWSDVITTDSKGVATGTIDFDPRWPESEYTLTIHYGYSAMGEKSTEQKRNKFILEDILPAVVEISLGVAAILATGGLATAFTVGAWTTAAVDVGIMSKQYLIEGFGAIDTNQYGCSFPILGFNHSYSFDIGFADAINTSGNDMNNIFNNSQLLEAYKLKALKNFWPVAIIGSLLVGLYLKTVLGGRSNG
jgi:hypothetical protein